MDEQKKAISTVTEKSEKIAEVVNLLFTMQAEGKSDIKDPNVIAIEIPSIYQIPKEYIGNSGATIKVVVRNINHSIEKILAGASQLFRLIRLNKPTNPIEIKGIIY